MIRTSLTQQSLTNADKAENKLAVEEGVLRGATDILQRIHELAVQGLNGTNSQSDRASIAQEIVQLNDQLLSLANNRDSSGNFLFSGFKSDTQPYTSIGSSYAGDSGQRNLQVGSGVLIDTNDPGNVIFESEHVQATVDSSAATASALIITQVGRNNAIPAGSSLDINFDPATSTLTVTLGGLSQTVTPYVTGQQVSLSDLDLGFPDVSLSLEGALTANDSHQLTTNTTTQTVFSTINAFATGLTNNAVGANNSPNNGDFLANIANAIDSVVDAQAKIGGRINVIEQQRDINEGLSLNIDCVYGGELSKK